MCLFQFWFPPVEFMDSEKSHIVHFQSPHHLYIFTNVRCPQYTFSLAYPVSALMRSSGVCEGESRKSCRRTRLFKWKSQIKHRIPGRKKHQSEQRGEKHALSETSKQLDSLSCFASSPLKYCKQMTCDQLMKFSLIAETAAQQLIQNCR